VTQHQLDRSDVDAIGQQPACTFVTQVVPVQIDLPKLRAVDASAWLRTLRVVSVRHGDTG
jgi:hypothetical protein